MVKICSFVYICIWFRERNINCMFEECKHGFWFFKSMKKLELHISEHYKWRSSFLLFLLCSHMVFNSSSLFVLMSNLIWINMNIMSFNRHMLICLFIAMLVGRESVIVRLGNEVIVFRIVLRMIVQKIMQNLSYIYFLNFFINKISFSFSFSICEQKLMTK
jgi:hypothetical protein